MSRTVKSGLIAFVSRECANWVNGECIAGGECYLQKNEPCGYFEKVLLPIAKEQGVYNRIAKQYRAIKVIKLDAVRHCVCGAELKKRQRLCEKCRRENRKITNRENQKKFYIKQRVSA